MAIDCWLTLVAELPLHPDDSLHLLREGTLGEVRAAPDEDRLVRGFAAACGARGRAIPAALRLRASSDIPIARGLGSSAAATVAGAAAANSLLDLSLTDDELISICVELEGHPDNVTPAIRGGATLSLSRLPGSEPGIAAGDLPARGWLSAPLTVHSSLGFAFAVPDAEVSTELARAALPAQLAHKTAVRASALSAALIAGLESANRELLAMAMTDLLHVPYRKPLVPHYDGIVAAAISAGAFGATLSGSGSTMLAIAPRERAESVANAMATHWIHAGTAARAMSFDRPGAGYSLRRIAP
jgi:homoserine kinase